MTRSLNGEFVTLKEACQWASSYIGRQVTLNNISYLVQYAKIRIFDREGNPRRGFNGDARICLQELKEYYDRSGKKEERWKELLGEDINWNLSFDSYRELERTKHVHRLHPYKGKFIPQLVEYFLGTHTNDFKKNVFFHEGDIILDPFVGSGTTLVQCLELGLHSIGVDISKFNCMISEVKVRKYELDRIGKVLRRAARETEEFSNARFRYQNESDFDELLNSFNKKYYPSPEFKFLLGRIRELEGRVEDEIDRFSRNDAASRKKIIEEVLDRNKESIISLEKEIADFVGHNLITVQFGVSVDNVENLGNEFADKYAEAALNELRKRQTRHKQTELDTTFTKSTADTTFLSKWFTKRQRAEMQHYTSQINQEESLEIRNLMRVVLSRTVRSCRATKHADLATLIKPQSDPYYCRKHFKICRPVVATIRHLKRYTEDTIRRVKEFDNLRRDVFCEVIHDDSRTVDIFGQIAKANRGFYELLSKRKIDGIFTSPPYVGQIDYHDQHAYAYELFNIKRQDELEIGKRADGTSRSAQNNYIEGISTVLLNAKRFLKENPHIFIVANDSKNLYSEIAKRSGLDIKEVFRRPVLNRTEKDKQPYAESIFHMMLS